jgi:tetratricopeptide (TPR) repeat protein
MLYLLAMSYKNSDKSKAYELFQKCKILINETINNDLFYDIFINLAITATELNYHSDEIATYYNKLISIFPDRSEPYYYWAIYCNKIRQFQKALDLLLFASQLSYDEAKIKYPQTNYRDYGKFLYDEMSVSYYWLNKYNKSKELILSIIDDPDFVSERDRIKRNLDYCNEKLNA